MYNAARFSRTRTTTTTRTSLFPLAPLLANDLHQHPLPSFAVEFAIEDFFPRTEIKLAFCDRNADFASHDSSFEMSVCVVFGAVVSVLVVRPFRSQFFQPLLKVAV